jgi:hypothetical protein
VSVDFGAFTGFGSSDGGYMPADTVEEQASDTGMAGYASIGNFRGVSVFSSPTRSLVALWFLALGAYWFMGWYFKGNRS